MTSDDDGDDDDASSCHRRCYRCSCSRTRLRRWRRAPSRLSPRCRWARCYRYDSCPYNRARLKSPYGEGPRDWPRSRKSCGRSLTRGGSPRPDGSSGSDRRGCPTSRCRSSPRCCSRGRPGDGNACRPCRGSCGTERDEFSAGGFIYLRGILLKNAFEEKFLLVRSKKKVLYCNLKSEKLRNEYREITHHAEKQNKCLLDIV